MFKALVTRKLVMFMKSMTVLLSLVGGSMLLIGAAAPECRTAALPDGTPALFCKDKKGNWKQQAGEVVVAPSPISSNAVTQRGQATYRGTFSGAVSKRQRQSRNLDLGTLLEKAIAPDANATRFEGAFNLVMKFDGASVTADVSGTGGMQTSKFTGLVRGGICRLTDVQNTEVYEGPCDQTRFSGTIVSTPLNRNIVSGSFDTQANNYVDFAESDARRAELKAKCDGGSASACVELDQLK